MKKHDWLNWASFLVGGFILISVLFMEGLLIDLESHHMAFIFAVVFMLVFRQPLIELILRIKSIEKFGIKTTVTPEAQREIKKNEVVPELLEAIGDSIVLKEFEEMIKTNLKENDLETEGDSISFLIKHLAITQIILDFERIYSLIFGSQIRLLKKLNEVGRQRTSKEVIQSHFDNSQEVYKNELGEWSLDLYLKFLIIGLLISHEDDGNYRITDRGVEFLIWMTRNGRSESRRF